VETDAVERERNRASVRQLEQPQPALNHRLQILRAPQGLVHLLQAGESRLDALHRAQSPTEQVTHDRIERARPAPQKVGSHRAGGEAREQVADRARAACAAART
jgi:hypothetical protein